MNDSGAIIFLTREGEQATMLAPLGVSTYLGHLTSSLQEVGVAHFMLACHEEDAAQAAQYLPVDARIATTGTLDGDKQLEEFLLSLEHVVVATLPIYLSDAACRALVQEEELPQGIRPAQPSGVYRANGAALRDALQEGANFMQALEQTGKGLNLLNEYDTRAVSLRDQVQYPHPHEAYAKANLFTRHAKKGVRVLSPETTLLSPETTIGAGTTLMPGSILRGKTSIGANCEIGPNTMITDCTVGDGTVMNQTQAVESRIGARCNIGPFAYIRPHCQLADGVKVGDFAELKNSTIGAGTKIPHLTYVGDSDVGAGCNFGCGSITVNYDGLVKERCVVEDHAFIGCNTNLVAPVHVGAGAYIAAGSTVTSDVPEDSLAIARARQEIKRGWAKRKKK